MTPKLSIVIVSYFVRQEVADCLAELRKSTIPMEVFVVDNASTDGTCEMLAEQYGDWPALTSIRSPTNLGLARANNVPIDRLTGEYTLILNPDTIPTPELLQALVDYLDSHADVGVVGPLSLYADGTPHSSFHHHWTLLHILLWSTVPRRWTSWWYDRPARLLRERDVMFVSGACLLIRTATFKAIGGYDEAYFLAVEDAADLCRRAAATGLRVVYHPQASIVHYGARSSANAAVKPFSLLKAREGHLHYARKWYGAAGEALIYTWLQLMSVLKIVALLITAPVGVARRMASIRAHLFVLRRLRPGTTG
jgi:N-acetylglucosaminyl-diphospho-decaprenol L-rhamnosyltransferase